MLLGGVSVEYDPAAGPTKFMVGCEQGEGVVHTKLSVCLVSCSPWSQLLCRAVHVNVQAACLAATARPRTLLTGWAAASRATMALCTACPGEGACIAVLLQLQPVFAFLVSTHARLTRLACMPPLPAPSRPAPAAHRNPFFPKYFLSVGDWTWRVWNEDLRSPLLVSPYAPSYLSSGTWSPSRPGEFKVGP
jgi:hypothetical protein